MKLRWFGLYLFLCGVIFSFGSCSQGNNFQSQVETTQVLKALSENVILPSLEDLLQSGKVLAESVEGFCQLRDEASLATVQQAWRHTQAQLKRSEFFGFGPYKTLDIQSKVDFWPARPENIEAALQGDEAFSAESLGGIGVTLRGLPAVEYLLFGGSAGSDSILEKFVSGGAGDRRCELLLAQGGDLVSTLGNYLNAWSPSGGDYAATLYLAGEGSFEFPQAQDAVNLWVNHLTTSIEILKDVKLGKPLGKSSGGEAFPELVESPFAENSLENMRHNIEGLNNLWFGDYGGRSGLGFFDLVHSRNPIVAESVATIIERALSGVEGVPPPLAAAILEKSDGLETAFQNIRDLRNVFSASISGILGVNPFFSDTDGD